MIPCTSVGVRPGCHTLKWSTYLVRGRGRARGTGRGRVRVGLRVRVRLRLRGRDLGGQG